MYLIDTNVLSELPRRSADPAVLQWVAAQSELAISAVTLEELVYGVERAKPEQAKRLRRWLDELLALPPVVVPVDAEVARAAGQLRAAREWAGHNVAQADMLIAATALRCGRVLVTRNVKDFADCGVSLLNPFTPRRG